MIDNQNQNENISNFKHNSNEINTEIKNKLLINPSKMICESNINNNNYQPNFKKKNVFSCEKNKNNLIIEEEKGQLTSYNSYFKNNNQIKSIVDLNKNNVNNNQKKNIKNYKHYKFINNNAYNATLYGNSNIQVLLENSGNTTYMITVLRCLTNIKCFNNYYLKYKEAFIKNAFNIPISYALSRIIVHLFPEQKSQFLKKYSIKKFHSIIIYFNPIFKGQSTKNATDFLMYIINQMHEEYKIFHNKSQLENSRKEIVIHNFDNFIKYLKENEYSNISIQFAWINKKVEKCWECNKEIITFNNFLTYDLEFENALNKAILNNNNEISIVDCINYVSEEKNIYNIFCTNCKRRNNFIKKSVIYSLANSLIFLIRGMEKKEVVNDIKSYQIKIKIDENLNLFDYAKNKKISYYLNGLIAYDIEKLEYIAYSISPIDKKWYKYSKDNIISMDLKDFINENDFKKFPVILFYNFEKFI